MTTERPFLFAHMLQVSKWSVKSDLIDIFNDFIYVYSLGARAENPLGTNFWCQQKALITSTIWILILYTFFMFFHVYIAPGQGQTTYKSMSQIWPCCKIGQGQPRVIIWTNYDGPKAPMLHTKPQGHWPFGSGEDFWKVFTIYGHGGHLGHVTHTPRTNFRSPIPLRLHMKFGFDWPSGFGGLWKWWRDNRSWLYYKAHQ